MRLTAARAVCVVARNGPPSMELLHKLSKARKDSSGAVSRAVRRSLIVLREFGLLKLHRDLSSGDEDSQLSRRLKT